jgi:hypothetical protein
MQFKSAIGGACRPIFHVCLINNWKRPRVRFHMRRGRDNNINNVHVFFAMLQSDFTDELLLHLKALLIFKKLYN